MQHLDLIESNVVELAMFPSHASYAMSGTRMIEQTINVGAINHICEQGHNRWDEAQ